MNVPTSVVQVRNGWEVGTYFFKGLRVRSLVVFPNTTSPAEMGKALCS